MEENQTNSVADNAAPEVPNYDLDTASNLVSPVEESAAPAVQPEVTPLPVAKAKTKLSKRKMMLLAVLTLIVIGVGALVFLKPKKETPAQNTSTTQVPNQKLGVAATLVEGKVEYSGDGDNWQPLDDIVDLKEGDQVRTGADGRVILTLDDGSAARLGNSAVVSLVKLDAKDVVIDNKEGELYSRVVGSNDRKYTVNISNEAVVAKGTAFKTMKTATKAGVEVYQSATTVKQTDVTEGKAFYFESSDASKKDKVSDLDLESLKNDEFVKWNAEQDKQMSEARDKLGVLAELDKPAPAAPAPKTTAQKSLTLKGALSGKTAKLSWTVTGVDVSKGFKIVKSTSTKTPTFPANDNKYVSDAAARSTSWDLSAGKTYYIRVCAYRGDSCDSYSNMITLTTPKEAAASDDLVHGTVTASLSGAVLSWSFTGTAPQGFKVVANETGSPQYPADSYVYFGSAKSFDLSTKLESGQWYVRVCKYLDGSCTDYSNQVTYTK